MSASHLSEIGRLARAIFERCERLTSGNVAHDRVGIQCMAQVIELHVDRLRVRRRVARGRLRERKEARRGRTR